jgi:O-antigen ligase
VTLFLGAGALTAVSLLRGATPRLRWAYGIAAVLLVLGSFVGGGRGSLIGLAVGAAALAAVAISSVRLSRRQWALGITVALLAAGAVAFTRGSDIALAIARAKEQIQRSETKGDPRSSAGYRLYWWPLALQQWRSAPIVGTGAGSWQRWATSLPETQELAVKLKTTPDRLILAHPHSTYLQTVGETGAIGGVLTLLLAYALGRSGASNARRDPVAMAGFATLALWSISAAFEGNHITSRAVAAFALAFAFAVLPGLLPPPAPRHDH